MFAAIKVFYVFIAGVAVYRLIRNEWESALRRATDPDSFVVGSFLNIIGVVFLFLFTMWFHWTGVTILNQSSAEAVGQSKIVTLAASALSICWALQAASFFQERADYLQNKLRVASEKTLAHLASLAILFLVFALSIALVGGAVQTILHVSNVVSYRFPGELEEMINREQFERNEVIRTELRACEIVFSELRTNGQTIVRASKGWLVGKWSDYKLSPISGTLYIFVDLEAPPLPGRAYLSARRGKGTCNAEVPDDLANEVTLSRQHARVLEPAISARIEALTSSTTKAPPLTVYLYPFALSSFASILDIGRWTPEPVGLFAEVVTTCIAIFTLLLSGFLAFCIGSAKRHNAHGSSPQS